MSLIPKKFRPYPQILYDTREGTNAKDKIAFHYLRTEFRPTELKDVCSGGDLSVIRRTFKEADYGLAWYSGIEPYSQRRLLWERKSIGDLYGTLGKGREAFSDEVQRLQSYQYRALMIAGVWQDMLDYAAYRRASAKENHGKQGLSDLSIANTLGSLCVNDQIFVFFCGSEEGVARKIEAQAMLFWKREIKHAQHLMPKRGEEARK